MRCLERRGLERRGQEAGRDAVGVCQSCGAAVCAAHAVSGTRRIRRGALTGAPAVSEIRKIQCGACAQAHTPVPVPVPGTVAP